MRALRKRVSQSHGAKALPVAFFKKSLRGWQANYQAERDAQSRRPEEASRGVDRAYFNNHDFGECDELGSNQRRMAAAQGQDP